MHGETVKWNMYFACEYYETGRRGREEGEISLQVKAPALTL